MRNVMLDVAVAAYDALVVLKRDYSDSKEEKSMMSRTFISTMAYIWCKEVGVLTSSELTPNDVKALILNPDASTRVDFLMDDSIDSWIKTLIPYYNVDDAYTISTSAFTSAPVEKIIIRDDSVPIMTHHASSKGIDALVQAVNNMVKSDDVEPDGYENKMIPLINHPYYSMDNNKALNVRALIREKLKERFNWSFKKCDYIAVMLMNQLGVSALNMSNVLDREALESM